MNAANRSSFVYVTFIRTTPEKLWQALTEPEFIRQYWFGVTIESQWKTAAPWKMTYPDGRMTDSGEIIEIDPPRRMVLKWQHELMPELKAEGAGRCTFELQPQGGAVKLTITHEIDKPNSKLINAVADGWPKILSNLKSLLETGKIAVTGS